MERYALRLVHPDIPAPAGLRVLAVRDGSGEGGPDGLAHETMPVVAIQSQVVHHYTSDDPRPVHPDPTLMERLGWHYRHQECRHAPICITSSGRVEALDPDDPCWILLPPDTPDDRVELLARRLKDEEGIRRTLEHRIEDIEQDHVEGD
ncbi:hypothetical protein [Tautonia plasticadhaerens]|uniref:Uncharacterized protein n=1 Tax=Tautonia plasticadhaerens TaxID=2527974 RepID=A0A518H2F8_9BACT|nr:hypothetical protein [Tautonia plasticadhaerens]QDV35039.1 hypothetical protein ElP_29380 [Tautonia plasticadhaerens]